MRVQNVDHVEFEGDSLLVLWYCMTNQYVVRYEQQKPFVAHQASFLFCDFAQFRGNSLPFCHCCSLQ